MITSGLVPPLLAGALAWGSAASRAVAAPDARGDAAPEARGGAAAGALTLERAIELAVTRHERAQVAEASARIAEADLARARAFFFPELSLRGTYTRRAFQTERQGVILQQHDALSAVATLQLTLFDARSIPLYRAARLARDAQRLVASEVKRQLAFQVSEAFLTALSLEEVAVAAEHRLEFAKTALADARARFDAALVSSNDVTRPELELATAERELTRARASAGTAKLELAFLVGEVRVERLERPGAELGTTSSTTAGARVLVTAAEARRIDLEAARIRSEAASVAADEPLMRLFPSLRLSGEVRATNEAGLSGHDVDGSVSLVLEWPIFDGGERYADRDAALARARIAELDAESATRLVGRDVEVALLELATSQAARAQVEVARRIADRNARETQELYRQGLASALEVSDASLRAFEAEVSQTREAWALLVAHLELRFALGLDPLGKEWPR